MRRAEMRREERSEGVMKLNTRTGEGYGGKEENKEGRKDWKGSEVEHEEEWGLGEGGKCGGIILIFLKENEEKKGGGSYEGKKEWKEKSSGVGWWCAARGKWGERTL